MPAALQLGEGTGEGWVYDSATQTWVYTGASTFDLTVYANADGSIGGVGSYAWDAEGSDTQTAYIIVAATPDVGDVDGFDISLTNDGEALTMVASGYGTPPLNDTNSIATHGIYDTYFEIYEFEFDGSPTWITDTQPGGSSEGTGYVETIEFTMNGMLDGVTGLHVDLFTDAGEGIYDPDAPDDPSLVNAFAPSSHDIHINSPLPAAVDDAKETDED